MLSVKISGLKEGQKRVSNLASRQLPFAIATALNTTVVQVAAAESEAISKAFDRPTPFTIKSVATRKATKTNLQASVFVRPIAARYLLPYETGGTNLLNSRALLKPIDQATNAYGNLPRNVLSRLKGRSDVFIGPVKTKAGVLDGVWQPVAAKSAAPARKGRPGRIAVASHLKLLIRFSDDSQDRQTTEVRLPRSFDLH